MLIHANVNDYSDSMSSSMDDAMDQERLSDLSRLGCLLDEAVDLADRCGETLLGAQIAQAVHCLDQRVAELRDVSLVHDRTVADRGKGPGEG